jgi:hypothetical protein
MKAEATSTGLARQLTRLVPYILGIAYYLHLDGINFIPVTDPAHAECQAKFNKALHKFLELGIGVWLYDRIKADAKDLEASFLNLLPQFSA